MSPTTDTALLVIDAQESFRQRPDDWAATANPQVFDNIALLVAHARAAGDAVAWVTHSEPGTGGVFDPDSGFVRVVTELEPRADEIQVTKTTVNAFTSTDLQRQLAARGIGRLVVCGIRTEQCCETTARIAGDLGFVVEFVTDATTTSPIPAGPGYAAVSGDDLMRRTESVLGAREFATITTTARRVRAAAAV
ncbi:isochorismatase family protein [Microbacterium jiangjiandongii]|uniref:isochorismatase family protein n=1 Tax=Microbacterium jiangjiandongii TaxID=3049071 RepID=UPI00214A96E3|nr:isochorismatase family protein [Microbacterium sp. zg.Y843]MCR2816903.1 isochorismatase family protein [Microbacterium sp. zg.Y843]